MSEQCSVGTTAPTTALDVELSSLLYTVRVKWMQPKTDVLDTTRQHMRHHLQRNTRPMPMQPQHQSEMLLQTMTRVRLRIGMLASSPISMHTTFPCMQNEVRTMKVGQFIRANLSYLPLTSPPKVFQKYITSFHFFH